MLKDFSYSYGQYLKADFRVPIDIRLGLRGVK